MKRKDLRKNRQRGWGTVSEINFIRGLGRHAEERTTPVERKHLLRKYIEVTKARGLNPETDYINPDEVLTFAQRELEKEERLCLSLR